MELDSVNGLSKNGIAYEKALRETRYDNIAYVTAIEAVATDPAINKLGLYNIDTADFRLRSAKAQELVEQAHQLICENHKEFNAIAEKHGIEVSVDKEGGR